jgi:AmmeMemoRadiSam system protein B
MPVDSDAVEQLADSGDADFFADELVHRTEHSIEFQTVFLKHILPDHTARILPILCSTPDAPPDGKEPAAEETYASFATSLREIVHAREKTCVIAGVDLSHIGPRFGAVQRVGQDDLEDAEQHDRNLLGFVEKIDPSGFYEAAMNDGNRRNVCGVGPIYLLLQTVRASNATLLKYEQAYDPNGTVTFASACFTP